MSAERDGRSITDAVGLMQSTILPCPTYIFYFSRDLHKPNNYSPEEWGPEVPLSAPRYAVPMPTLYSTEGYRYKKPSVIEMLLYNMAAMLGGVAAGYDVRLSNVTPLHPRLQPYRSEVEPEPLSSGYEGVGYAHNTYHGPIRHLRAPLNAITGVPMTSLQLDEARPSPLRFTDSPTQYAHASSSSGYAYSAQPSATSGLGTNYTSTPSPRRTSSATPDPLADLYHNYRENFPPPPAPAPPPSDYISKHAYCGYEHADYRDHRRTPSDSSVGNVHDEYSPARHYPPPPPPPRPRHYQYGRAASPDRDRPANLGLELAPTKLRSSLKKYKKTSGGGASGGSTPTNPTPPDSLASCPSASETDSSYVSARDTSGSSQSRVRFSPETMAERRHS